METREIRERMKRLPSPLNLSADELPDVLVRATHTLEQLADELEEREDANVVALTLIAAIERSIPWAEPRAARRTLYVAAGFAREWVNELLFTRTPASIAAQHAAQLEVQPVAELDDVAHFLGHALLAVLDGNTACAAVFLAHASQLGAECEAPEPGGPVASAIELLDAELARLDRRDRRDGRRPTRRKGEGAAAGPRDAL